MITDFVKLTGVNLSGLVKVEFVPIDQVDVLPAAWEQEIATAVTLIGAAQWLKAYYTQGTGGYSCPDAKDPAGDKYKIIVEGFLPKELLDNTRLFHKMSEDGFLVIAYDSNGNRRLCGTKEKPMRFTWSETTLSQLGGRTGYQWQFYREMIEPAPFYTE